MKKSVLKFLRDWACAFFASAFLFASVSCNVGLGESVDTEAPKLEITYPPVSAAIRDSFILYGTCSDDKEVTNVKVTMMNTGTNETVLSEVSAQVNSETWQIKLNSYDASKSSYYNGWQFADGTYQVNVTAYDNAGHSSGTASRTFDIDNTPPVFIISNPGVVKSGTTSPSAYGSIFTVEGTIADDHTIGSMDVVIYNESGEVVSNETYNGAQISSFHEDDIPTAGGTSVIIAQYDSDSTDNRYYLLHPKSDGTEYYTASIKLTDSAKVYQNPTEESNSTTGNETYSLYLYDDVYTKLMSAKKGMGLSAADLKNIVNKTATNDEAKAILDDKIIDTEGKSDTSNLYFSLNPQANPTYQVNGFAYDFADSGTIQTASSGNALSITVSAGLDGTNIDLDGNDDTNTTVKVWMKEYSSKPSASGTYTQATVLSDISALATEVTKLENAESSFVQYKDATSENAVTEAGGFKLIYDYAQNTSGNESSVSTKTFSVTIPEGSVSLGKYYIIAVTGSDVEDVVFLQNTAYGFEGNEAGVAPTVVIASPEGASLQKSSDFAFSGTATLSSGSLYVTELKATLTVTDQNTNTTIGTYTEDISRTSADAVLSGSDALVCADGTNWTFTPSLLSSYAEIQAAEGSKKSYIYTLEIYGKSSSGHDTTVSSYVQIDSTPPVVEIASITPTVDGSEYDSSENTYVNGTITVKGNIEETNLEKVTMQVFVGGEAASCFTDSNGNASDTLDLGKVYSFTQTIDTTSLTDEKSLDIRVTATDKVGNSATYSSLDAEGTSYGKLEILQETDRPKITLGNSSNSSSFTSDSSNISEANGNLFGTTSNNQLTATISDDDSIALVKVTVYDESGNLLDGTKIYSAYNQANPYTLYPNKSSASLTYYLPPDEGVYQVCIDAYDYLETETNTKSTGKGTTGNYFIAVSAGAPSVTVDSYSNYQPESPTFSGKVSTFATEITATFVGSDSSNSETYQKTLADQPTTFTATKTDGSWSGAIAENASTLSDGEYSILFTAQNKYGQTSSTTVIFTVDTNAPTVTPLSGSAVVGLDDSRYVTLAATVNDSSSSGFTSGLAAAYYIVTQSETSWQTADAKVENYVSSSTLSSWSTLSQGKENWNATLYLDEANYNSDATVYVYFAAVDQAGNIGVSSDYEKLTLDNTQPSVVLYQDESCATEISSSSANPWARNGTHVSNGKITFYAKVTDTNVASTDGLTASSSDTTASNVEVVSTSSTTDGYKIYKVTMPVDTAGITTSAEFKGHDANGRESTTASVYVKCDIVAPEISDVTATATVTTSDSPAKYINQSNSAKVSGKVTENNISTVNVYLLTDSGATSVSSSDKNAAAAATATSTAGEYTWDATVTGVDDGTYYVAVVATDTFGNTTTKTDLLTYIVDITSPVVGALSVKSGGNEISSVNIASKGSDITISATAKDAISGISSVALYDGTTKISDDVVSTSSTTATDGTLTYTFTISSTNVEKVFTTGTHTLSVRATDKAGNTGTSESKTISSDVTAPTVSITDATPEVEENNETHVNGKITVSGTAQDETALDGNNLAIKIYKSDDTEKKDLSSTDGLITESSTGSYTLSGASKNWKFVLDTTKLTDEFSYVIEVTATDKAGNPSNEATKTIAVKQSTDAPGIEITSVDDVEIKTIADLVGKQKNILAPGGKITATITDDDGIASATVSYQAENASDKSVWTTSNNLISTSGRTTANISYVLPNDLAEGGYLFKIDVTDTKKETNYYTKATTVAVAVDSGAPEITLSNTNGNYYNTKIPVSGSVSDASGKVTLQASYGSDGTNSATGTYSTAADVVSTSSTTTTTSATLSDTITVSALSDNTSTGYTATYTATDRWGQSKTASLKYYVDKTAPGLSSTADTLGSITGYETIISSWFKDEALKAGGQITESGSGIEAVYYWLNPDSSTNASYTDVSTATGSFGAKSVTGQAYNYTYSSTVSGFAAGTNSFTIVARDNAGNLSNSLSYTVKVDMTEPEFVDGSMKIMVNGTESSSSTLLVNGNYPVTISGTIKDLESKINTSRVYISIGGSKITAKESALDAIGSTAATSWQKAAVVSTSSTTTDESDTYTFTAIIPAASLTEENSGVVYLLITDNAENRVNNVSLVNITVDSEKPTVKVNLPSDADTSTSGTQVNGKITLSGTASDNNELSAITKLEYSTDKSNWTELSGVTFTGTTSWTSSEIDTTALTDNTTYYFRVTAKDKAENEGTSDAIELYVSQDTDRPIVKISGLTKQAGGSYILKYVKNSVLSGTVSDDDSQNSKIVDVFYISESAFDSSSLPPASNASFNAASGDWTFTPADTADGSKEIYFYIKDNAGKEYYTGASSDSSALNLPKLYLGSEKAYSSSSDLSVNNSKFTYVSDSNPPEAGASASGTRYNSSGAKVDVSSDATGVYEASVNSSFTAGGSAMPKASFTFTATDNNGISGAVIEISDSSDTKKVYRRVVGGTYDSSNSKVTLGETEYSVSSSSSASTDSTSGYYRLDGTDSTTKNAYLTAEGTTGTITTDVMDFSDFASGQVSVTFTVYDKSGLYSVGSYPFIVDNAGPDIKVSSPSSTTELTGDVSIIGQSTDTYSSASTIQYVVPTKTQYDNSSIDMSTLDWTGSISATSTVSSWTFNLDDADNDGLNKYDSTDSARSTYGYTADDGIYTLPIWFKATDTLGNVSYNTTYQVRHNPDGDKPLTEITYPTENDYSTSGGITAAILNGSIRVTGSSSVPSNTTTINSVYLQIDVDGDGDFDDADKSALETLSYTVVDYSSAYVVNSEASAILEGFEDTTARDAWWGIAATVKSSSWNISINDGDKIYSAMSGDSPSITNTNKLLHIRASGVNNKGKVGAWSNSVAIKLDSDTPLYEVSLVKLKTTLTSNSSLSSATSDSTQPETTASQEYSSNMYIRGAEGEWYLKIKATDNVSVNSVEVSQGNTTLADGSGFFHSTLGTSSAPQPTVYIYVPVSVASSKVTYKVSISDNADPVNSVTPSFTLNIDNTAPSLSSLTGNSSSLLSSTVPNISDSDYRYTLKGESSDSGSGFERAVFYFVRKDTVGSYTISNNVIIDPYIAYTASGGTNTYSSKISLTGLEDLSLTQGSDTYHLYGKKVSGSVVTTTTFTPTTLTEITGNASIRAGGLIYVDGVYRLIESIDSSGVVTFSPACSASISSADAVFPYAQVVDHAGESASDYSPLTWTIAEDDGDGMIENVSEAGASTTWTGTIHACNIPDGPVSLVVLVFDAAGNVNGKTIDTFVSNNAPRLAKVNLATDLNGDNIFKQEEFVEYSMYAKTGSTQESYTLNFSDYGAGVFKIKDALAVVPEFTGGNGTISMVFKKDATDATAVTSASGTSVTAASSSSTSADSGYSIATGTTTVNNVTYTVDSLTFTETDVSSDSRPREASSSMYAYVMDNQQVTGKSSYAETDDGENKAFSFTFWDSTDETSQGSTSQKAVLYVPAFTIDVTDSVAPTGTVTPFYWNGDYSSTESDNMKASNYNTSENNSIVYYGSTRIGHIDLTGAGTNNNPDISGTIKIEGEIIDDQRIGSVEVVVGADSNGTVTETIPATSTYTASSKTWSGTGSVSSDGYKLTVTDVSLDQTGHKAKWTLLLDTSKLSNGANAIAVTTTQAKSNSGTALTSDPGTTATTSDELTGYYPVRVVPYITSVARTGSTIAEGSGTSGNINRSKLGHYSVAEGETLTVYGWNFGESASWSVGKSTGNSVSPTADATSQNLYSFTMTVPSVSGELSVTSNSVISVNNSNSNPAISGNKITNGVEGTNGNNAESYSMRGNSTVYYASDDRYFDVWALGNYFNETSDGAELRQPVMTADANGNLFASWADQTNSQIRFSYGIGKKSTAVFRCYDQPGNSTGIAFDRKGDSGAASLAFMAEHQGYGGTFSNNALASNAIVGGMGAISIPKSAFSGPTVKSGMNVAFDENPVIYFDSAGNTSGYYTLESYDMIRRLGAFENPRSARYDNYIHSIWYDSVTESLRYSVANTNDQSKYNKSNGAVVGWVVLDGGYTGQDRLHTFEAKDSNYINNTLVEGSNNGHAVTGKTGAYINNNAAYYSTDIFLSAGQRTEAVAYLTNITKTSVTMTGVTSSITPATGDTIALMYNKEGGYAMSLRTITSVNDNKISWDENAPVSHTIQSAAVYKGALNVVDGSLDKLNESAAYSGSSGSSADIDVDTNGYPVVAYFDDANSTLKIAKADDKEPKLASNWTRIPTGCNCSGSVSMRLDGADNIHIMYKNEDGQLCYLFGTENGNSYTFNAPEIVDETGSLDYGEISIIETEAKSTGTPCMTYMNSAGTAQAVKYAWRTSVPASGTTTASTSLSDNWDYLIVPSLGSGHYAVSENQISIEARKSGWTGEETATLSNGGSATATPATVQAAIAFKSNKFETAYLKKE